MHWFQVGCWYIWNHGYWMWLCNSSCTYWTAKTTVFAIPCPVCAGRQCIWFLWYGGWNCTQACCFVCFCLILRFQIEYIVPSNTVPLQDIGAAYLFITCELYYLPRCAFASEVYGSVFVCAVCLCRVLQLLCDQQNASKSFYRLLVTFSWIYKLIKTLFSGYD